MYPVKLHTKPVFRIFHILKINRIMPFCKLFMEQPPYIVTVISILCDKVHDMRLMSSMLATMSGRLQAWEFDRCECSVWHPQKHMQLALIRTSVLTLPSWCWIIYGNVLDCWCHLRANVSAWQCQRLLKLVIPTLKAWS